MEPCPCGSGLSYMECCCPVISGKEKARTAEQLMRSRYSAYVKEDVDYLVSTTHPKTRSNDLAQSIRQWMDEVQWLGLHVLNSSADRVEFMAEYLTEGKPARLHERSVFKKQKGEWFYVGQE